MKKLIIFLSLILISVGLFSQTTKKISAMTPATSVTGTELIPIVQSGTNKSVTPNLLMGTKVNIADTAAMLTRYLNRADSTTGANKYATDHRADDIEADLADYEDIEDLVIMKADSSGNAEGNYMTRENVLVEVASAKEADIITEVKAFGSTAIAIPVSSASLFNDTYSMLDGTLIATAFYLREAKTITGVKLLPNVAGIYTAADYNGVGLYKLSGTTYTLVASSTDNGDLWKGAAYSLVTVPFTTPYSATAGAYYVALLYNNNNAGGETAPKIYVNIATGNQSVYLLGGNNRLRFIWASQTALPATILYTDVAVSSVSPGIWLY